MVLTVNQHLGHIRKKLRKKGHGLTQRALISNGQEKWKRHRYQFLLIEPGFYKNLIQRGNSSSLKGKAVLLR